MNCPHCGSKAHKQRDYLRQTDKKVMTTWKCQSIECGKFFTVPKRGE